jgi:16S rRNA (cytidine1402-2'-O)-methyltransferase
LYVVATPIGNLEDMTPRALRVLRTADVIAAEDTRVSGALLRHFGIGTRPVAVHEHSERGQIEPLLAQLRAGRSVALMSDAGTPLVSDPGYRLVRAAHAAGIPVVPVPGACAAVAALSAAGLPSDRFAFEGFPPPRAAARRACFEALRAEPRTLVFYETPHRILGCLADLAAVFGSGREAVVAREITKKFESIRHGTLGAQLAWYTEHPGEQRGEFVLVVRGVEATPAATGGESENLLRVLLAELPLKQAVALAARITGHKKNELYDEALRLQGDGRGG